MNTHFRERRSFARISRRQALTGLLGGSAALIDKTATAEVVQSDDDASTLARFTLTDDAIAPKACAGDVVIYDTAERHIRHGNTYLTQDSTETQPYLSRAQCDAHGRWWLQCVGQDMFQGPMTQDALASKLCGRITAVVHTVSEGAGL